MIAVFKVHAQYSNLVRQIVYMLLILPLVSSLLFISGATTEYHQEQGNAHSGDEYQLTQQVTRQSDEITPIYNINNETKLILLEEGQESGLIVANLIYNDSETSKSNLKKDDDTSSIKPAGAFNYTVILHSKDPRNFAIWIDVEEISFPATVGCRGQELSFLIVNSTDFLATANDKNNKTNIADANHSSLGIRRTKRPRQRAKFKSEKFPRRLLNRIDISKSHSRFSDLSQETIQFPLTNRDVWTLLNKPLNETLLDLSGQENPFELANSLVDKTLKQLEETSQLNESIETTRSSKLRMSSSDGDFLLKLSSKLERHIGWDILMTVCGPTKGIIIPLRTVAINVYGDEFGNDASFKLRFKFIQNPDELDFANKGIFLCRNRRQIDLKFKCNGYDDCGDASDESSSICQQSINGNIADKIGVSSKLRQLNEPYIKSNEPIDDKSHEFSDSTKKLRYFDFSLLHCCNSFDAWSKHISPMFVKETESLQGSLVASKQTETSNSRSSLLGFYGSSSSRKQLKRSKRIIGGKLVPQGRWPAQVSLESEYLEPTSHWCAGTLIHPQYVITATHCISEQIVPNSIKVVLGQVSLIKGKTPIPIGDSSMVTPQQDVQVRYVQDLSVYPGLDWAQMLSMPKPWRWERNNDITLLRLDAPVLLGPNVMPACLAPLEPSSPVESSICETIGWGSTQGSGNDNDLKTTRQQIVDDKFCRSRLNDDDNFNNQTLICSRDYDTNSAICSGDSGGPLYCKYNDNQGKECTRLSGIVSATIEPPGMDICGVGPVPNVFANAAPKAHWILSQMKLFEEFYSATMNQANNNNNYADIP